MRPNVLRGWCAAALGAVEIFAEAFLSDPNADLCPERGADADAD
jgi:hypothetical protein